MHGTDHIAPVEGLAMLAGQYDAVICDVWGVVHNGATAYPAAVDALARFRQQGGRVVLVTNAPRRQAYVARQMDDLGVSREAWDALVTSGDVVRTMLEDRAPLKVLHVGPDLHIPLYDGLDIDLVSEGACELVSCTGLYDDESETPEHYATHVQSWRARDLPLLCVNPDIVVERGGRLVWCAGSIARDYANVGGRTEIVGKPHPLIYRYAFDALSKAGGDVDRRRVLAVGDGVATDLTGASREGIDALYVTAGIDAERFGPRNAPETGRVSTFLGEAGVSAIGFLPHLVW